MMNMLLELNVEKIRHVSPSPNPISKTFLFQTKTLSSFIVAQSSNPSHNSGHRFLLLSFLLAVRLG